MQNSLKLFCLLIFFVKQAIGATVQDSLLSVSAECRENDKCIFENSYINVDVVLKNISNVEIGVPVEFLKQLGPYGLLVDNETQEEFPLHVGLPDLSLENKFTSIPPGASIKVTQFLSASTISWSRKTMVDVTARFAIHVPIKPDGHKDPVSFSGSTSVHIVGKDKLGIIGK